MYRKGLEGKERESYEKKAKIRKALAGNLFDKLIRKSNNKQTFKRGQTNTNGIKR